MKPCDTGLKPARELRHGPARDRVQREHPESGAVFETLDRGHGGECTSVLGHVRDTPHVVHERGDQRVRFGWAAAPLVRMSTWMYIGLDQTFLDLLRGIHRLD